MSAIGIRAAVPGDWGGLALLALLTAAIGFYGVVLALRARLVVRSGWTRSRAHPGPLLGLLCGITGLALAALDLGTAWQAAMRGAEINWHAHQWTSIPMIVCGFAFTWTAPGRRSGILDRQIAEHRRAHPQQALAGFLVGAATWALFPLVVVLPLPVRFACMLAWITLIMAEIAVAIWWWWRHGRFEELMDGQRTVYLPSYAAHPVFWGWLWGTATTLLIWTALAEMRMGL